MLKPSRTAAPPCATGCRCDTCLTGWLNELPARDGDRLAPWSLDRRNQRPGRGGRRNA